MNGTLSEQTPCSWGGVQGCAPTSTDKVRAQAAPISLTHTHQALPFALGADWSSLLQLGVRCHLGQIQKAVIQDSDNTSLYAVALNIHND